MPIADLLGVQFDMHLLWKVSVSVAAVLLVSWAYRFYSSRNERRIQTGVKDEKEQQNANCQNCKTTLHLQSSPKHDTEDDDGGDQCRALHADSDTNHLLSDNMEETQKEQQDEMSEGAFMLNSDQANSLSKEISFHRTHAQAPTSKTSSGSALNLPDLAESGTASRTGRHSPCLLEKLEGAIGVGRELRQDLESQGAYSSFLSKAEIKVKDANIVREGTGDPIARGKIYEYYVESSSHSVTDLNTRLGQYDRKSESQPVEFVNHSSSLTDSPSSSPITMQDLIVTQSTPENASSLGNLKLRHPTRPLLLRTESYAFAAEKSELPVPFQDPRVSTPVTLGTSTNSEDGDMKKEVDLETVVGASLIHLPAKILDGTDLEVLKSKLDLGNCLETLYLAKKHGQTSVQQAALGVMSDNYLHVLRDSNLYSQLMAGEREQIRKQRMSGRQFVMVADMDPQDWQGNTEWQAAATEQKRTSSAVYYYDDYKDTWHTLCMIPQEVISKACAMCTMDNYLFVAVGCQGSDREMIPSKRVFCFNPLTSIWKEISPMNVARPRCKLAALEGYIYAIGGECLSSVERYDPRLDRWTFVAPLPSDSFAVVHQVTVCDGELFVSGGTVRYMLLRYNPKTNTWRPSLIVGNKDRTADMVAVGRFLYRFDVNPLLGVSVYRYHTVARLWYECSSKRILHCPAFQCVTVDGTVYCVSRQFTMRFDADEVSPAFTDEDLSALSASKGILFPFVLSVPDKELRQTSV
ncbi:kelch domain-containing protein 7A [Pholidichthys leucotaenia]